MDNPQNLKLEKIADLFRTLALAPQKEREAFKRGLAVADWEEMEKMANFAGMLAGVTSNISLRGGALGEMIRTMVSLQDRALETIFIDV